MFQHSVTIALLFLLLSTRGYCETLETIRQLFEVYQRSPGEIEILFTSDTKEIDNVLKRTETKRLAVRKELDKAQKEQRSNRNQPSPLFAEEYAAPFSHYVTDEYAFAKRSLEQDKPEDAVLSIRYVYSLAEELSASGSLELRAAAARMRLKMLETAQSVLLHPLCKHEYHELLYKIFDEQIHRRTSDSVIWEQYRDEGKQFFTEIAKHGFGKMIPPNVLKELGDRHAFREYAKAPAECIVQDQANFFAALEKIIESSAVPFFQRQPILRQLDTELREHRGTAAEPVFTLLLLRDVSSSMLLFAQERSGIETAYLALSASLEKQNRQKPVNFLTGKGYELRLIPNGVMCTYEGNIKAFYVPYRQD